MKRTIMRIACIFFMMVSVCLGGISYYNAADSINRVDKQETVLEKASQMVADADELFRVAQDSARNNISAIISYAGMNVKAFMRTITFLTFYITILIIVAPMIKKGLQINTESGSDCHLYVIGYIQNMDGKKKIYL